MAFPAVNDIIQTTIEQRKDQSVIMNVLYYRCTVTPSSGTERGNLFSFIDHLWAVDTGILEPLFTAVMADDHLIRSVKAQVVAPTRHAYVEQLIVDNGDLDSAQLQVANLSWVIVKQTARSGPAGRGTLHMIVPQSNWLMDGELTSDGGADRIALRDALDDLVVVPTGGEYEPVLYHAGQSPNYDRITHATIKSIVRPMARRTVGRGI